MVKIQWSDNISMGRTKLLLFIAVKMENHNYENCTFLNEICNGRAGDNRTDHNIFENFCGRKKFDSAKV